MKKILAAISISMFVVSLVGVSYAAMPAPITKLKGGVTGIVKSPLEVPKHTMKDVKDTKIKPLGLIKGLINGSAHMVEKAGKSAIDVATFPVDLSK